MWFLLTVLTSLLEKTSTSSKDRRSLNPLILDRFGVLPYKWTKHLILCLEHTKAKQIGVGGLWGGGGVGGERGVT